MTEELALEPAPRRREGSAEPASEAGRRKLVVSAASAADDAAWDAYVRAHERGSFFHLRAWRRTVERVFRHGDEDLVARRDGDVVGVLPLMSCRGLFGRRSWISSPYAVYGGPIGDDDEVEAALFREAERRAVAAGVRRLELRCVDDPGLRGSDGELARSDLYATFVRDLPDDPADVLARMPKKARADARKAREQHGLVLDEGPWYVGDLARLFHRNKRALGSPGLPVRFFAALLDEHPEHATVHLVRRGDEPLAAVLSFFHEGTLLAYYSGTREGVDRAFKASGFMYMALQEWAVERGFRRFDFGRSRKDSGAFTFKAHQGFEPRDLHYRYRLVRDDAAPSLNPSNPRTKVLRDTWRRLPLWLTTRLSTPAARYLP